MFKCYVFAFSALSFIPCMSARRCRKEITSDIRLIAKQHACVDRACKLLHYI